MIVPKKPKMLPVFVVHVNERCAERIGLIVHADLTIHLDCLPLVDGRSSRRRGQLCTRPPGVLFLLGMTCWNSYGHTLGDRTSQKTLRAT